MTVDRQHGLIQISCDTCGEVFDGKTDDWNEVWHEAKAEGWKARKIGNEWVHACADCEIDQ